MTLVNLSVTKMRVSKPSGAIEKEIETDLVSTMCVDALGLKEVINFALISQSQRVDSKLRWLFADNQKPWNA